MYIRPLASSADTLKLVAVWDPHLCPPPCQDPQVRQSQHVKRRHHFTVATSTDACIVGRHGCGGAGVVGGIVLAVLLALCICFMLRRKRNKQVGEKRVAAKQQKEKNKQQRKKKASGPWFGFLRRKKGGLGTGVLHASVLQSVC